MPKKKGAFKKAQKSGNLTARQERRQSYLARTTSRKTTPKKTTPRKTTSRKTTSRKTTSRKTTPKKSSSKKGSGRKKGGGKNLIKTGLGRRVNKIYTAGVNAAKDQAQQQAQFLNPNQNLIGGSQTVTYDENGNPTINQQLDDQQQSIYDQGTDLTIGGQQEAQGLLRDYEAFGMSPEELEGMRGNIEDQVFARMTRGVDEDEARERAELEQTLYNRGIPLDPTNPQYKRHMDALNEKYGDIRENARQTAVATGGQEMSRQFGMGLQGHQSNMYDMGYLQQQGTGLMMPNFQGYQGPAYDPQDPFNIWAQKKTFKQNKQALNQQGQLINAQVGELGARAASYGAGGGGEDPFTGLEPHQ